MLLKAAPDEAQRQDTDFLLGLGEIFTLIVYGQLILENANIYQLDDDLVDQIFDFMVRDFSKFALQLHSRQGSTESQMELLQKMLRKSVVNGERYRRVWENQVYALNGVYEMNQ